MKSKLSIFVLVFTLLTTNAQPSYAWWFLPQSQPASIQPESTKGPVLSPLIDSLIPKFLLEPLQQKEVETPPTATTPTPSPSLRLDPLNPEPSQSNLSQFSQIAQEMLSQLNTLRRQHNLGPLTLNNQLTASAQKYAERMQQQNFFSHTAPDGQTFRQRNEAAGYTNWQWMGENIGRGQKTVDEVIEDWMNSPSHRQNILDPKAKELGVGYAPGSTNYWVQEFGLQFP